MTEQFSMYREQNPAVIMYHNINERKCIDVPHLHSQYEIYYNIHGAKGFFCDKKFYSCSGNDLFVVQRANVHKVVVTEGEVYERCIINIDSKIIDSINSTSHINHTLEWMNCVGSSLPGKVNLCNEEHNEFIGYIDRYNSSDDELSQFGILIQILAFTGRMFKRSAPPGGTIPDTVAGKALLIIEENFRNIKISDIARQLYINDSRLGKIFKDECGITLSNYLILRKIAEAKKYLYLGISVKEACYLAGFNNYSNFIRTFKKFEGYSPGNMEELSHPI